MDSQSNMTQSIKKLRWPSTLLGAFLLNIPCGLPLFIGNLSVYYISYVTVILHEDGNKFSPWMMPMFDLAQAIGTVIAGVLPQRIGSRWTLLVGTTLIASGYLSCYIAVQISPVLLLFTLAVLPGLGAGLSRLMSLTTLFTWSNGNKGFFSAVPPTAFGIGSIAINQFLTRYINPNGIVPVVFNSQSKYFNQPDVLHRVPLVFIYLGTFALVTQLMGSFMLFEKKELKLENSQLVTGETNDPVSDKSDCNAFGEPANCRRSQSYGSYEMSCANEQESKTDFKPKWMLSNALFYVFLLLFISSKQEGLVFYTYYKLFGQTWIENDYFLTNMGTVISFVVMIARPLWGLVVDKIGVKNVSVIIFFVGGFVYYWIYVAKYFDKWLYFVVCITVATVHCACIIIFPVLVSEYFDKKHFVKNFGLLLLIEATLNTATPFGVTLILQHFGWLVLFGYIGAIISISAIICVLLIPNKSSA